MPEGAAIPETLCLCIKSREISVGLRTGLLLLGCCVVAESGVERLTLLCNKAP